MVSNLPRKKLPKCNPKPLNLCYDVHISVSLCLGVCVLNLFVFLCECFESCAANHRMLPCPVTTGKGLGLGVLSLHFQRITPLHPLRRTPYMHAADTPEQSAALSGISRASRHSLVQFQRLAPSNPPAISADLLHNLQQLQCGFSSLPLLLWGKGWG